MSQIPPNPYGNPPPPPPPPYGQPPPGQYPPAGYPPPGSYPPPTSTSGSAITSLVCGLILCVPFVTGLLALIFGIVGIRATKTPAVKGRGMAIAGLILGIIGLIGWTAYFAVAGAMMYALFSGAANPLLARAFFTNLQSGNVSAAQAECAPGTAVADLQATADEMKPWGPITDLTRSNTSVVNTKTTMSGTIQTQNGGPHAFTIVFDKAGSNPVPQVQSWDVK